MNKFFRWKACTLAFLGGCLGNSKLALCPIVFDMVSMLTRCPGDESV